MYDSVNESIFEALIKNAFIEYTSEKINQYPSEDEMKREYPISQKELKKYRRRIKAKKYRKPLAVVYLERFVAAILIVSTLSFGVLATNTKVRAAIADVVIEWYDKYIKFNFNSSEADSSADDEVSIDSFQIGFIPEGFTEAESSERTDERYYMYVNSAGEYLIIQMKAKDITGLLTDIENNNYEEIIVNNHQGYMLFDDERNSGTIIWTTNSYAISVDGITSKETLIKIAENIN